MTNILPRRSCVATLLMLSIGCDQINSSDKTAEKRATELAERQARYERDSLADALAKYISAKSDDIDTSLSKLETGIKSAIQDLNDIAKATDSVDSERTSKGEELNSETKLLRLIRREDINALAIKYLSADFKLAAEQFIVDIRECRAAETRYETEIGKVNDIYESTIKDVKKWSSASKEQRENEISRLQKEISSLEARRLKIQKDYSSQSKMQMAGGKNLERQRWENKTMISSRMSDIEHEIDKKRGQIDYLRNPHANRHVESAAVNEAQYAQRIAQDMRRHGLEDVEKHFKPKTTVAKTVTTYMGKTIGALRFQITKASADLTEQAEGLRRDQSILKNAKLSIPMSDIAELKKIKQQVQSIK